MHRAGMRVGELAKRTGVSVRALHYYEEIGLLSPAHRTEAGYRLYAKDDVVRLQGIMSLRQLGFSLDEIRDCLNSPRFSPQRVIELHITRLRERIELQRQLCDRLEAISETLRSAGEVSAEEFMQTIEEIDRVEKYYTPEQLEELRQRREEYGDERIRQAETEWSELIDAVRAEMDAGTDPADERVQALARHWMDLVGQFTGGNPRIEHSLRNMWQQETEIHGIQTGPMREMGEYISKAMEASRPSNQG